MSSNYVFGRGYGQETTVNFHTDNGQSILQFKPDVAPGDVVVTADAQGDLVLTIAGNKLVSVGGTTTADCSGARRAVTVDLTTGVAANNGFGVTDQLVAGAGTERLVNSGAAGFYDYAGGTGKAAIVTGAPGNAAGSNELDFGPGISDEKLWLILSGNDLQTDVMGKQSQMTVAGWFAGTRLQDITAILKRDIQVSKLVKAMATYAANTPGFDPAAVARALNDPALQTAIAAAWHA
jgi:hypothetical protein